MSKEALTLQEKRNWYRLIDHTADTGFRVWGSSLKEVFEHAAFALFDIMADLKNISPVAEKTVEVTCDDMEALMVDWLSELNYLFFTEGLIFSDFSVMDINEGYLSARVKGERYRPNDHIIHTEVKAITYHGMYIRQNREVWEAQVILDL